ncbi:TPA: hypothetical protein PC505_003941 [Morganella morganii]|nr:hypothetical protein [Morganella morganii]HDF2424486.1 hypothetical protein [Morganella morganii]
MDFIYEAPFVFYIFCLMIFGLGLTIYLNTEGNKKIVGIFFIVLVTIPAPYYFKYLNDYIVLKQDTINHNIIEPKKENKD